MKKASRNFVIFLIFSHSISLTSVPQWFIRAQSLHLSNFFERVLMKVEFEQETNLKRAARNERVKELTSIRAEKAQLVRELHDLQPIIQTTCQEAETVNNRAIELMLEQPADTNQQRMSWIYELIVTLNERIRTLVARPFRKYTVLKTV